MNKIRLSELNRRLPPGYQLGKKDGAYVLHISDAIDRRGLLAGSESPCYRKAVSMLEKSGIYAETCIECLSGF